MKILSKLFKSVLWIGIVVILCLVLFRIIVAFSESVSDGLRTAVKETIFEPAVNVFLPEEKHSEHEHSESEHSEEKHSEHEHSESEHSEDEHSGHKHSESVHSEDEHSGHKHSSSTSSISEIEKSGEHQDEPIDKALVGVTQFALDAVSMKNLGIDESKIVEVRASEYRKSRQFPAVIEDLPGVSRITVPSPAAGIITKIHYEKGTSVEPGSPICEIELNREMVLGQTEYLALLKEREINAMEIERVKPIETGAIPKLKRDLEYDRSRLDLQIENKRKMLLNEGLDLQKIVQHLDKERKTINSITVYAPGGSEIRHDDKAPVVECPFTLEELSVNVGRSVQIGDPLCQLSDLCRLTVRGSAFASDEAILTKALSEKNSVFLAWDENEKERNVRKGLHLRSIENRIDSKAGTVGFYVDLENSFTSSLVDGNRHDGETGGGSKRRYANWRFKPGRRCELYVEYETIPNCIVLPLEAVTADLSGWSLFEWTGKEGDSFIWKKRPVHLILRTKDEVVLANDGSIAIGSKVATRGASFLLNILDSKNSKGIGGGIQHGDHVH